MSIEIPIDETYRFTLTESTDGEYGITHAISEWIHTNLSGLTDDNDDTVFSKVNYGYDENRLKGFTKKPVCDVYVNNLEFDNDFESSKPIKVNTIVIFTLKGANNHVYLKACEVHDYLLQEFVVNESWRTLDGKVSDTRVMNSQLMNQPSNKVWYVMGAIELSHHLF